MPVVEPRDPLAPEKKLSEQLHPMAPHHLPFYLAPGGGVDTLMVIMGLFLIVTVLWVGTLYWRLHSLPERMAHKSQKLQFEFVAVLGLISLFTHMHIFWIAGLLLALVEFPDFGGPVGRIADALEKMGGKADVVTAEKPIESIGSMKHVEPMPTAPSSTIAALKRGDVSVVKRPELLPSTGS